MEGSGAARSSKYILFRCFLVPECIYMHAVLTLGSQPIASAAHIARIGKHELAAGYDVTDSGRLVVC